MKLDIFCEVQQSKPWKDGYQKTLFDDTLAQAEAADAAGFDTWWQVEHHGSPEFSYSSAPEIMLTAISQRTRRLRVGHAGVLAPFKINHPLRVAERAATLDILSGGRFELGLAKSGGKEWETFGVDPETTREQVREAFDMIPRMWSEGTFSWNTRNMQIPERDVLPKPLQQPHPRLWQTSGSPESFRMAGNLGVGVLGTTLLSPLEYMAGLLAEHDKGLEELEPHPVRVPNREKGVFTFVHVAESRDEAIASGAAHAALWYVHAAPIVFKVPRSVWYDTIRSGLHPNSPNSTVALTGADNTSLEIAPDEIPVIRLLKRMALGEEVSNEEAHEVAEQLDSVIIGDQDHCLAKMKRYQGIGCTRLMCLMQIGNIPHKSVVRSIQLAGSNLIPLL